jgi:hypothetical protein
MYYDDADGDVIAVDVGILTVNVFFFISHYSVVGLFYNLDIQQKNGLFNNNNINNNNNNNKTK